jgi:hypothetical protein
MFKTVRSKVVLARRRQLSAARRGRRRVCRIERLEDRHYLTAAPFTYQAGMDGVLSQEQVSFNEMYWQARQAVLGQLDPTLPGNGTQWVGYSNATPEGAEAILQRELQWALLQAADATNPVPPQYGPLALPTDPMFPFQWHLRNVGQEVGSPDLQPLFGIPGEDINVLPVWQGMGLGGPYFGEGIEVAVFDSGIQLHPDLVANIHPTLRLNATNGSTNASPSLTDPSGFHGTAVAGIIGAVANNGLGGAGVAPDVTLVPIRRDFTNPLESEVGFQFINLHDFDISNNSWGPVHSSNRHAFPLSASELEILRNSVNFGRGGFGIIHVFSSGNDGGPLFPNFGVSGNYDSSSYNAFVNSRYTIGVTGVDHDGLYGNYDVNGGPRC